MRLRVDQQNDVLYLRLDEADIFDSEEVSPGVILDFDKANNVIGVEILGVSKRVPKINLKNLQFETA